MFSIQFIVAAGPILCTDTTEPVTDVPTGAVADVSTNYATFVPASAVSITLTLVIVFITLLCICAYVYKGENHGPCRAIIYCCNCLAILVLLSLIIAGSILVFLPSSNLPYNSDCVFLDAPKTAVAFSYAFIIIICCSWFVCYCTIFTCVRN